MNDYDFGFTATDIPNIKDTEVKIEKITKEKVIQEDKLQRLHDMIMPLIQNLMKEPNKEYLHWPDRTKKVLEFREKINRLMKE